MIINKINSLGSQIASSIKNNCNKTYEIAKTIFKSPLIQILALTFLISFTASYLAVPLYFTLPLSTLPTFLISTFQWKKLKYEISLAYTILTIKFKKNYNWYDRIELPDGKIVYLGAIPLKEHITKFNELNIKNVITLLEPFEMQRSIFANPLTDEDYLKSKITRNIIETPDFLGMSEENFDSTISIMNSINDPVYIHCKAGRGRSASVVVAYLMARCKYSLEDAIQYVKERRSQINLKDNQKNKISAFLTYYNEKF